jgi:glycosyltransferase involved in cell wall biosynthesis
MTRPADILPFPATRTAAAKPPVPIRRIAFVINSLGPGGAERVMNSLLHMAPKESWECHLALLDRETEWRTPPDFVHVHRLDCRFSLLASVRQLREKFAGLRPDIAVSFLVRANVATVAATAGTGAAVIISERSHLTTHLGGRHTGFRRWAAFAAPRLAYPRAHHVIAVSDGVRSDLIENFAVDPDLVTSIPNPYDLEHIGKEAQSDPQIPLPERFMVSVGRLVAAKGFDDLIQAYALAKPEIPLCILGEGPDRDRLEALIAAMGLDDRVHLLGYVKNPFAIVSRAELFVSASHCEGFPNAMAEAMTLGLPVLATDCPSGPAEILAGVETTHTRDVYEGEFGMLVPVGRPEAMARALYMMTNPARRARYSAMSRQRMDGFRIEVIADRYWKTFTDVLDRRLGIMAPAPQSRHEAGRETA